MDIIRIYLVVHLKTLSNLKILIGWISHHRVSDWFTNNVTIWCFVRTQNNENIFQWTNENLDDVIPYQSKVFEMFWVNNVNKWFRSIWFAQFVYWFIFFSKVSTVIYFYIFWCLFLFLKQIWVMLRLCYSVSHEQWENIFSPGYQLLVFYRHMSKSH